MRKQLSTLATSAAVLALASAPAFAAGTADAGIDTAAANMTALQGALTTSAPLLVTAFAGIAAAVIGLKFLGPLTQLWHKFTSGRAGS